MRTVNIKILHGKEEGALLFSLEEMLFPVNYITSFLEGDVVLSDFTSLLEQLGVSEQSLSDPLTKINGLQFRELLTWFMVSYAGNYPLSLTIGERFNISTHGIFGLAMLLSENLSEMMTLGIKYRQLVMPAIHIVVEENNGNLAILLSPAVQLGSASGLLIEVSMCVIKECLDQTKQKVPILGVEFSHSTTMEGGHYEQYFGAQVSFNRECSKLIVPSECLGFPMSRSDPHTLELLKRQLQLQLEQLELQFSNGHWTEKVKNYCDSQISRLGEVTKDEAANHFHMSPRTLTRKLHREEQCFKQILDSLIKASAEHFILNTGLSIQQVSDKLGYSNQRVFSRAFKRLNGFSPSQFRMNNTKAVKRSTGRLD